MKRKILGSLLAMVLGISTSFTVFAADTTVNNSGGSATSDVSLTLAVPTFSVTVPTQLPVAVSDTGVVTCADSGTAKIVNNGHAPIYVSGIAINAGQDWSLMAYDAAFDIASAAPGTQKIGFKVNNVMTTDNGTSGYVPAEWALSGNTNADTDELALEYDACLPVQIVATQATVVAAQVVFTVAWDTVGYYSPVTP